MHLYEERLDITGMMERALAGLKIEEIQASEKAEFADFLLIFTSEKFLISGDKTSC